MARDDDRALILRRGPVRWVQAILWDTAHDTFERGQWLNGRVYEEKCDLSPDGELFVYFSAKHGKPRDEAIGGIWTAVSKPPYFTALALWPQMGTYGGGGLFADRRKLALRICSSDIAAGFTTGPLKFEEHAVPYDAKWERDGWFPAEMVRKRCVRWVKAHPRLGIHLSFEPDEKMYTLRSPEAELLLAEWADFDRRGRLVFAAGGKIFARPWDRRGRVKTEELADFCADKFVSMEAPGRATRW